MYYFTETPRRCFISPKHSTFNANYHPHKLFSTILSKLGVSLWVNYLYGPKLLFKNPPIRKGSKPKLSKPTFFPSSSSSPAFFYFLEKSSPQSPAPQTSSKNQGYSRRFLLLFLYTCVTIRTHILCLHSTLVYFIYSPCL